MKEGKTLLSILDKNRWPQSLDASRLAQIISFNLSQIVPGYIPAEKVVDSLSREPSSIALKYAIAQYLSSEKVSLERRVRFFDKIVSKLDFTAVGGYCPGSNYYLRFISELAESEFFETKVLNRTGLLSEIVRTLEQVRHDAAFRSTIEKLLMSIETAAIMYEDREIVNNVDFFTGYKNLLRLIKNHLGDLWESILLDDKHRKSFALQAMIHACKIEDGTGYEEALAWLQGIFNHSNSFITSNIAPAMYITLQLVPKIAKDKDAMIRLVRGYFLAIWICSHHMYYCSDSLRYLFASTLKSIVTNSRSNLKDIVCCLLSCLGNYQFASYRYFKWNVMMYYMVRDILSMKRCRGSVIKGVLEYLDQIKDKGRLEVPVRYINLAMEILFYYYNVNKDWQYVVAASREKQDVLFWLMERRTDISPVGPLAYSVGLLLSLDYKRAIQGPVGTLMKRILRRSRTANMDRFLAICLGLTYCDNSVVQAATCELLAAASSYTDDTKLIHQYMQKAVSSVSEYNLLKCKVLQERIDIIRQELKQHFKQGS